MTATLEKDPDEKPQKLPENGMRLRRRRRQLRFSLDGLVHHIGNDKVIYKQLLARLERGEMEPRNLRLDQMALLAQGLNWSITQLADALELRLPKNFVEEMAYRAPTLFDDDTPQNTSVELVLNCYDFSEDTWMTKQVTKSILPSNATPVNTFVTVIQGKTLASLELHPQLHHGLTIAFNNNITPNENDTVFVHDESANVYGIVSYKAGAERYAVVSLDEGRAVVLASPKVIGVMSAYTNYASSFVD